ncbi:MAG TPA: hypothetical protein VGV36_06325 [Solirubrobacteraceae bacterium]|nr:hypothetical protein [Solirubrobacteraceae bacterium]
MSEQPGHAERDQDETSPQTGGGIEPHEAEDISGTSLADDEDAEQEEGGAAG